MSTGAMIAKLSSALPLYHANCRFIHVYMAQMGVALPAVIGDRFKSAAAAADNNNNEPCIKG